MTSAASFLLQEISLELGVDLWDREVITSDRVEETLLLVELKDWLECGVVLLHAGVEHLFSVVLPDDQWLAGDVVTHWDLWWLVSPVVNTATARMEETTTDTLLENGASDVQVWDVGDWEVKVIKDLVQGLGLSDCPWNAVEDEAALVGLGDGALDNLHDCGVVNKLASLNDALHTLAEWGLGTDFGAESVASAEVIELEFLDEVLGLSSLARAWWAEEDDASWLQHPFSSGRCNR